MRYERFIRFVESTYRVVDFCRNTARSPLKTTTLEWGVIRILFNQQLDEKSFRERRRITLDEVARETSLSRPTLSRLANVAGYVTTTETIERLCRYFGCGLGELLVLINEEPDGHP